MREEHGSPTAIAEDYRSGCPNSAQLGFQDLSYIGLGTCTKDSSQRCIFLILSARDSRFRRQFPENVALEQTAVTRMRSNSAKG